MKHFFYRLFIVVTWLTGIVYFMASLTPYINPISFWPMSFLALGFPYLTVCLLIILFMWIFIKRKTSILLLLVLLAGYKNLEATIAIHFFTDNRTVSENRGLRILTWNVRCFDTPQSEIYSPTSVRMKMFRFMDSVDADIVCLQEFVQLNEERFYNNIQVLDSLGYHYYYFPFQKNIVYSYGLLRQGSAIFSKVPIMKFGKTLLGDPSLPEYLLYADVSFQNKPVRIFTGHFKSIHLFQAQHDENDITPLQFDSNFVYTASQFTKLKVFGQEHAKQAKIAKAEMEKSEYPVVLGMDMNSVPTSYTYHTMHNGLQDAFIKKGAGLAATLDSLPPTLRIDFLLVDKSFEIKKYDLAELHLSDHFPQVVDLIWKR